MHYVYLIQSESDSNQKYYGIAEDLKLRLKEHNGGKSKHTAKFVPWKLVTYVAISNKYQAYKFEKYLKSHSGRAFANKRLW